MSRARRLLVLLPGDFWKIKKTRDEMHGAFEYMMARLEERKKAYKPEVTNDYIDFFMHRQRDAERPEDSKHFSGASRRLSTNQTQTALP